jgi:glycerate kinase
VVAGLRRLPGGVRDPLRSSSFGVGQLLAAALERGASKLVLGAGGSACTDGGAGMVQALGVRLADHAGRPLPRGGAALADLAAVDASGLDPRLCRSRLLVASDVDSPLLGPTGAARMFGPQKGASPAQVRLLERALARWADATRSATGRDVALVPGAGSAGGVGFAALAYLDAAIRPGIELVLELVGMDAALAGAALVVTGEGRLDRQTLRGKAPAGVAAAAARHGVPVVAVAGRIALSPAEVAAAGFTAGYSLSALEPDRSASISNAEALLTRIGRQIAADLPRLLIR